MGDSVNVGFSRTKSIAKGLISSNTFSVLIIIAIMLTVMIIIKPDYLSASNIATLSKVLAVTAIVGFSQMISISSGGMNVSIGATGALSAIIAGWMMEVAGIPTLLALLSGLIVGVICGVINGYLIYRNGGVGVASFLVTLATASVFTGINLTITQGRPFHKIPDSFISIGNSMFLGLPKSAYIMLVLAIALFLGYKYLNTGKQVLAFGANPKAAQLYGISKFKTLMVVNITAGILAAAAGLIVVMRISAAQPDIGSEWMLLSFAAPLIGGTRMAGGKVSILGTILGAVVLTIVTNALVHLKVDVYWNQLINGLIILLIVATDRMRKIKN